MHKRKTQAEFIDQGLGFPVRLRSVPMVQIRGVWTPDIDYDALSRAVLRALCFKPARLTGNEVRFMRVHHDLTLERFAEQFGLSHPAVMKWERAGEASTNMQWSTEKDLRLWLFLKLGEKEDAREFVAVYRNLDQDVAKRTRPLVETTSFSCRGGKLIAEASGRGVDRRRAVRENAARK